MSTRRKKKELPEHFYFIADSWCNTLSRALHQREEHECSVPCRGPALCGAYPESYWEESYEEDYLPHNLVCEKCRSIVGAG